MVGQVGLDIGQDLLGSGMLCRCHIRTYKRYKRIKADCLLKEPKVHFRLTVFGGH